MDIVIRRSRKQDIFAVQKLMDLLNHTRENYFAKENRPFHQRTKQYSRLNEKNLKREIFLVVESGGVIAGFARGSVDHRSHHKLEKLGYIDEIYVKEEYRGKGLGKKLLSALANEFKQRKCDHIATHTDWENTIAQKLYHSFKMHEVTVEFWKKL